MAVREQEAVTALLFGGDARTKIMLGCREYGVMYPFRMATMLPTNRAFLKVVRRAERQDDDVLQKTFVDVGSVFDTLSSVDHQIVYGRRGTGKTHLLTVFKQSRRQRGEVVVQIDMRNIGSSGGIYSDPNLPLAYRGTRLLIDVLAAIHNALYDQAATDAHAQGFDLGASGQALDHFLEAHVEVKVQGTTSLEKVNTDEASAAGEMGLGATAANVPSISFNSKASETTRAVEVVKRTDTGQETLRVNFGRVGVATRALVDTLPGKRLWLLLDEWSEVPLDIQPYLADLLRRALLATKGIVVKIAAIEQRSKFLIPDRVQGNVGFELGADVASAVNLDDHMVFDNDEARAVQFFKALVFKHLRAALDSEGLNGPTSIDELISQGFTQANAFAEVVRACEGVPRDAINILSHAAQRANHTTISVSDVRVAAQQWYLASKDGAVGAHDEAKRLLTWIIDKVIKERQAKAFLLQAGTRDDLIEYLYDERVLHVLRKGMSSKDSPGKRFTVYGIDYGCYVDLISTARAPKGVLDVGGETSDYAPSVPLTDLRSIRRCVLDLAEFYGAAHVGGP